jgi:glutaminyl-peptide cyclotransferase
MSTFRTPLSSISLFVLLDLLGSKNPTVPSYFKTTHWAYKAMATIESRLRSLGLFKSSPNHPTKHVEPQNPAKKRSKNAHSRLKEPAFLVDADKTDDRYKGWMMQDDHVPFMQRGVEILHLIPSPFPRVWHTLDDDGEHLDMPTVEDWTKLVTAFAAEWLDLDGFFDGTLAAAKSHHENVQRGVTEAAAESGKTEL